VATPERILAAAVRRGIAAGAGALSVQDVADEAGVSKALVHYHFHDKDTLLARLVRRLATRVVERERAALSGASPPGVVDAMWEWLDGELARGELRLLVTLSQEHGPEIRRAAALGAAARREVAAATIAAVFTALALVPRVPPAMLSEVVVAFIDGLATRAEGEDAAAAVTPPRAAFDVLWLALLNLAE
jgi:AcrR family transcriptional regulator